MKSLALMLIVALPVLAAEKAVVFRDIAERERTQRVATAKSLITSAEKDLKAIRYAKIVPGDYAWRTVPGGAMEFPSVAARDKAVKEKLAEIKAEKAKLDGLEKAKGKFIPAIPAIEVGAIGSVDRVTVIQIVDEKNMLVTFRESTVWVSGAPTAGIVDGAVIEPLPGVFEISGTKQYRNALGVNATVLLMVPFTVPK